MGLLGTTVPTSPRTGGHGLYAATEGIWSTPREISILSWADNFASEPQVLTHEMGRNVVTWSARGENQ